MSKINTMSLNYQQYKTYQQHNNDWNHNRTYSMPESKIDQNGAHTLGTTTIIDPASDAKYELKAEYANSDRPDAPFVKVSINSDSNIMQEYLINIEEVNVSNASKVEMFALLSYANSHEHSTKFSSGIWDTLTNYVSNNVSYAKQESVSFSEKPYEQKLDWVSMVEDTKDNYMETNMYKQVTDGNKLIGILEHYGMPEDVEMLQVDALLAIPERNYSIQFFTDNAQSYIEVDGNGEIHYFDAYGLDCKPVWSMRITQEQLEKIKALGGQGAEFPSYITDQAFWENYLNSDITPEDIVKTSGFLNEKSTYANLPKNLPDQIKTAWENAVAKAKENGFNIEGNESLLCHTEFARRYMLAYISGESTDILGKSVDSILKFAKESLEHLLKANPHKYNHALRKLQETEKVFYQTLIEELEEPKGAVS